MKLVRNTGNDRVVDLVRPSLGTGRRLDVVTPALSLVRIRGAVSSAWSAGRCRFVLPADDTELALFGSGSRSPGAQSPAGALACCAVGQVARGQGRRAARLRRRAAGRHRRA